MDIRLLYTNRSIARICDEKLREEDQRAPVSDVFRSRGIPYSTSHLFTSTIHSSWEVGPYPHIAQCSCNVDLGAISQNGNAFTSSVVRIGIWNLWDPDRDNRQFSKRRGPSMDGRLQDILRACLPFLSVGFRVTTLDIQLAFC